MDLQNKPMPFDPKPIALEGRFARIEPLSPKHVDDVFVAGRDLDIWKYMPIPGFADIDDVKRWIEESQTRAAGGNEIAFAIIDKARNQAVGSTRFLDVRREHRGLEIGYTWLSTAAQRTAINTECKLLLMKHAIEDLGAMRVQLKTDFRNTRSQKAIERIGGVCEGVLRNHMLCWDGSVRDTVMYSVTNREWPAIKKRLNAMIL